MEKKEYNNNINTQINRTVNIILWFSPSNGTKKKIITIVVIAVNTVIACTRMINIIYEFLKKA